MDRRLKYPLRLCPINVGPIQFPNNASLVLGPGTVIQARSGFSIYEKLLNIVNVSNVQIRGNGAIFRIIKRNIESGEYHCLDIEGASDVSVAGISCLDSGGDGLYIGPGSRGYSTHIQVTDSTFDNNRRQGMSIVSGIGVIIQRCSFTGTRGTAPADGIDIEPNGPDNFLQDILIQDSVTTGNAGNGVAIDVRNLNSSSPAVSVVIERHTSSKNQLSGYYASNENAGYNGGTGKIVITESVSLFDSLYGAVANFYNAAGPALIFQNLNVQNPNQARATDDNAAVAVKRGGGGQGLIGNVSFINTSITDISGSLDQYFTFVDYSSIGMSKVEFVNPGILFGAGGIGGLLMGQQTMTVNLP